MNKELLEEFKNLSKNAREKSYYFPAIQIYNKNLKILEVGYRNDEPIALVEKEIPLMNRKEYIVVFNYTVDEANQKLTWGYGYYYFDRVSGKNAYNKVIKGGNLSSVEKENETVDNCNKQTQKEDKIEL